MNKIWLTVLIFSIFNLIIINPDLVLPTMLSASTKSLKLCANLCGVYALWLGILEILSQTGVNRWLAKILRPTTKKLFGNVDSVTAELISINLSTNILGIGGASTPAGIKAMQRMDDGSGKATTSMIMLMVINATSIQLLPTTVIGLRAAAGSSSSTDIILPTLISTIFSTTIGILLVILCSKIFKKKKVKQ